MSESEDKDLQTSDNTDGKTPPQLIPFKAGAEWKGNARGRPKGSRNKLGEAFLADMHEAWLQRGRAAIEEVIETRPHEFLKVVAGILPKDVNLNVNGLSEIDDAELASCLASLRALADTCSAEIARAGACEEESGEQAPRLPPVH